MEIGVAKVLESQGGLNNFVRYPFIARLIWMLTFVREL